MMNQRASAIALVLLLIAAVLVLVGAGVGTTVYLATRPSKNDNVPTGTLSPGVLTTSF